MNARRIRVPISFRYVDEIITIIGQHPARFGIEHGELRVAPLKRHQYALAYRVDPQQITAVAVYHLASNPRLWQART